jgi:hypothetical protein
MVPPARDVSNCNVNTFELPEAANEICPTTLFDTPRVRLPAEIVAFALPLTVLPVEA